MRRVGFFLVICLLWPVAARAQADAARTHVPLVEWQFQKDLRARVAWEDVVVPHTWNAQDGQDGGDDYFRGDATYRRTVTLTPELAGKELYLRFEGANRRAEVLVNGKSVGKHSGGGAAFCFDVTGDLHAGENQVVVHVSNGRDGDTVAPLFKDGERGGADFTYWGGIYRPVELVAVNPLHIALDDCASPGIYISTPEITDAAAKVRVRTLGENAGKAAEPMAVVVEIFDAAGKSVAKRTTNVTLTPGPALESVTELSIPTPHRWNGTLDPYLYSVKVTLVPTTTDQGSVDAVTQTLGIRTFSVDPNKGFFLNGKSYPLHGVNRHQDRQDKGWAISEADQVEDIRFIKEIGANTVRLAHYQQSDYFYSLCDKAGMVVWAEVPNVNYIGPSKEYTENAHDQLTELVRQSYNHASIVFWSVGNEVRKPRSYDPFMTPNDPDPVAWFKEISALAHREDPGRLTAIACRRDTPFRDSTDVYGLNIYYGWYESNLDNIDRYFSTLQPGWALTEYGAGASIHFHSEKPVVMDHTEEYQCLFEEANWAAIKKHPEIWGSYVWNMFDFAADDRYEGDRLGINDKGLVTFDRKTRKDAFYFFHANWSAAPMVHLNDKRFPVRGVDHILVKAYSNAPKVGLTVNGKAIDEKQNNGLGTFTWENVLLKEGQNQVEVVGTFADGAVQKDATAFTYKPGAPTEVYEAQDETMRGVYLKGPPRSNFPKNPYAPPTRKPPAATTRP